MIRSRCKSLQETTLLGFGLALALFLVQAKLSDTQESKDLAQEIFDTMEKAPGNWPAHAKGIVRQETFMASKVAATFSHAAQFKGETVPLTSGDDTNDNTIDRPRPKVW